MSEYSSSVNEIDRQLRKIGKKLIYSREPEVRACLDHEDEDIRIAAIRVLGFYWQKLEFKDELMGIFKADKSDYVRRFALSYWAGYHAATKDKKVLFFLKTIFENTNENNGVRMAALKAILEVKGYNTLETNKIITTQLVSRVPDDAISSILDF